MIGKAIHTILKDKISDLDDGKIYPIVLPQNANYSINSNLNYPAIIYQQFTEYETSKDKNPNMVFCRVQLHILSNTYKEVNNISTEVRDVLDHYVDKTNEGLLNVPGYYLDGNNHSFISNVDISHIFYVEEEDDYYEKLNIYSRRVEYEVYYYNDIIKFNYNIANPDPSLTPSNPLLFNIDFTKKELMRRGGPIIDYEKKISAGVNPYDQPNYIFNKIGKTKYIKANYTGSEVIQTLEDNDEYWYTPTEIGSLLPTYKDGISDGTLPYVYYQDNQNIYPSNTESALSLPYGALFVFVYKPMITSGENYILGAGNAATDENPLIISHKKDGASITIKINPNGKTFDGASRERTLINSSDSGKYWGGDYHFLSLSLGGSMNYTGGSVNQQGWYEYFNSEYNPKLTTGQILKNNSITGNTDSMGVGSKNFRCGRIGTITSGETSAGFGIYEMLIFAPHKKPELYNSDIAPFQPTDIIYKKVKDYIYEKYNKLK